MGFFDRLVDTVVAMPARVLAVPVKLLDDVTEPALAGESLVGDLADQVKYVVKGTSKNKRWDGHNTTGERD
jgi:hypothetical protein